MEGVEGVEAAEPPQAPPSAAVRLQCALLDFLVGGLFNETAAAITGGWAECRGGGPSGEVGWALVGREGGCLPPCGLAFLFSPS